MFFLSFSGKDTYNTFTGHLYRGLDQAGIATFMANEELKEGAAIWSTLKNAIAGSRISIPIFSINYASSKWCLNELVQIMESRQTKSQLVFPIFYHVNPRDVRNQIEGFGRQFDQHAKSFDEGTVKRWKKVLEEAGALKGWDLEDVENRNESRLIQKVVDRVLLELSSTSFNIAKNLVGIDSCVMRFKDLLDVKSEDVRIVGIWGMGGIGKSTIAEALYKLISQDFEGHIFLEHVRQDSKMPKGLIRLQTRLLGTLLKQRIQPISYVNGGKDFIKKYLHAKKVLIILDDVDKREQLEALAGGADWFGPGSRIIISTRDEHVLTAHKVREIYEVKELYFYPSRELFSKHAFETNEPPGDFMELAQDAILTAGGLPLALQAFGSYLSDKTDPKVWRSTLERLRQSCQKDVQEKLKTSYDELDDDDREIFLDIACFFIGTDKEYATDVEDGCGFSASVGIINLIKKSLVKIDNHNKLRIHGQLRDMGRHIVYQESPNEQGKRSRLWSREEVVGVLKGREGTKYVTGIILKFGREETALEEKKFNIEDFEAMSKLRLLQIDNVHLVGDFKKLPSELRWLSWKGCPLESIPTDFRLKKLAVLDLSYSRIKQVWNDLDQNKEFQELKVLILSKCRDLIKTPDFSRLPNLEKLNLEGCIKLVELPSSICRLKSLKNLNLSGCSNLNKVAELLGSLNELEVLKLEYCKLLSTLPDSIGSMKNLKSLSLDGTSLSELPQSVGLLEKIEVLTAFHCKNLVKLPDSMAKMRSLRRLVIDRTGIRELPKDFGMLSSLEVLSMSGCREFKCFPHNFGDLVGLRHLDARGNSKLAKLPVSFCGLRSLTSLDASSCNLSEGGIPSDLGKLSSLEKLYLSYNDFCSLPTSISALSRLEYLGLDNCRNLQSLPELPSTLRILNVKNCEVMETLSNLSGLKGAYQLNVCGCEKLAEIGGIEKMESLQELWMSECSRDLVDSVKKSLGQGVLQRLPLCSSSPPRFTPPKLKLSDASIWDKKRCHLRLECDETATRLQNPEQHWRIVGMDLSLVFTNQEINDIYVEVNRNGECVYSQQISAQCFTPRSHQDQTCFCHLKGFYKCVHEFEEGDEITFTIETALETEVKKSGMYVVYEDTKQSNCCKRIGDFFTCSYDDEDVVGGRRASSRKRRKLQLLNHDDNVDDDDSTFSALKDVDQTK